MAAVCVSFFICTSVRIAREVISIQNGGGMLTSSIRRAHGVRTKVGRLQKQSVLKSDWFSVILTCRKEQIMYKRIQTRFMVFRNIYCINKLKAFR